MPHNELLAIINLFNYSMKKGGELIRSLRYGLSIRLDIQVLGIGSDGHIAFNEPGCPFESLTHLMDLTEQTRRDNARFFDGDINQVPKKAATMGLASIMRAKKIIMIATGLNKADAIKGMIEGKKTVDCPASILQDHPEVYVFLDEDAASKLTK